MRASLGTVLREWGRIGVVGFGGPPAHVALLRDLMVRHRRWMDARAFEDANAACGLLPGPASTQLAIFCARHVAGTRGALVGGLAFILPGLAAILLLAAVSLAQAPPAWVRGVGAGAGAAVVAVVMQAGLALGRASLTDRRGARLARAGAYVAAGAMGTVLGALTVVVALLGAGMVELGVRRRARRSTTGRLTVQAGPVALLLAVTGAAALPALAWTAFKVGALSYGGGLVIIPLMQADAVDVHAWMTDAQFLNAVALGQLTPGPVVQTVAVVGYAAAGLGGALVAALIAFSPSFLVVLLGGTRFEALRNHPGARAFLDGAGPSAVGAILGAVVPLAGAIAAAWQVALLGAAALVLASGRAGVVAVLAGAGAVGALAGLTGAPLP